MSGEGPESIPTSADPRSKRAVKKRALTPVSAQASTVEALFARPDQDIRIPDSSSRSLGPRLAAPPEIVTNVQGSSAGAGSGEFHVYKASRRREYERLRQMDEEVKHEQEEEEFERLKEEKARKDEEKTRRNREKREKMKARKAKAKAGGGGGGKAPIHGTKGPRIAVTRADGQDDTEIQDAPAVVEEPKGLLIEDD
ncbi:putative PRKR-interacting protein 1 [Seiridium unicorne]|uniref:PRKR-interacting protein 1 n=1 Tax=Seiridium unicorne TaxID=138068 RepID=A0ABR2VCV0_9PEZI